MLANCRRQFAAITSVTSHPPSYSDCRPITCSRLHFTGRRSIIRRPDSRHVCSSERCRNTQTNSPASCQTPVPGVTLHIRPATSYVDGAVVHSVDAAGFWCLQRVRQWRRYLDIAAVVRFRWHYFSVVIPCNGWRRPIRLVA